ncbi:FAD-dependent oxidoreductase [Facklamia sp. DSM 111018]|uniref:FAD-dependent oxidoreductase n=1 Tax=Facklamia lactis TaxID=2749967 RepID=A0ABS0LRL7_9LACT|nr:FAD-dependent oxidoreductase [Facklamia lactis]MBG9986682.1 FAD-dependent oxidoreductase [Facklamia lactis]
MGKRLLLAGGGHGHVYVLKRLINEKMKDIEITLVSDSQTHIYSGMIAGYLEDIYDETKVTHHLKTLCHKAGVTFIEDHITKVDHHKKIVTGRHGDYPYDFLGMDLGSAGRQNPNFSSHLIHYVKPAKQIIKLKEKVSKHHYPTIAIVGGGASGMEIAFALRQTSPSSKILLFNREEKAITNFNIHSQTTALQQLGKRKIQYYAKTSIDKIEEDTLYTDKGSFTANLIICALGVTGVEVEFKGFRTDQNNFIQANSQLFIADQALALGDMIYIDKFPFITKAGVYAVHASPIYYHNLMNLVQSHNHFRHFDPPKDYLAILNTGGRTAILNHRNISHYGRIPFEIKNFIDQNFMQRKFKWRKETII